MMNLAILGSAASVNHHRPSNLTGLFDGFVVLSMLLSVSICVSLDIRLDMLVEVDIG